MSQAVELNQLVDNFNMKATGSLPSQFAELKGKNVILYFYPKDLTPGCTIEAKDFRDHLDEFAKLNTVIIGVSRDNLKLHEKFQEECGLPFDLISDEDEVICQLFNVIKMKNLYGKQVRGIERSTFLIDVTGKLVKEWRNVKVDGHVNDVLLAVKKLTS